MKIHKEYSGVKYLLVVFVFFTGFALASDDVPVLTYQEACERAVEQATSLKLAGKGVADARIMTKNAYTNLWPRINGIYNYTRFQEEISFDIDGMEAIIQPESTSTIKINADMPIVQLRVPLLIRAAKLQFNRGTGKAQKSARRFVVPGFRNLPDDSRC